MTRFAIQSFGCRVNQAEAFDWVSELQRRGMTFSEDVSGSDLVLVNTCTLTNRADRDVRAFIRKVLRDNQEVQLIITGCYAERTRDKLFDHPRILHVFSNTQKEELASIVADQFGGPPSDPGGEYRSRALVKIQDGCNLGCSFCVIPSVRGDSRSLPVTDITKHVSEIVKNGYSEVVLTGIHIGLYGRDLGLRSGLLDLIQALEKIEGLWKIRLSSLDPRYLDDMLIDHITGSPVVCPHFHLSLQSGSDEVLRRMGRGNSSVLYRRIMKRFRAAAPDAALGADIIVGFPGETEARFRETEALIKESPLNYFHVFSYSPRSGTPAAGWEQVDEKEKKSRSAILRAFSVRRNQEFKKKFTEKVLEGVVIKQEGEGSRILTTNYIDVLASTYPFPPKTPVRIKITAAIRTGTEGVILGSCG